MKEHGHAVGGVNNSPVGCYLVRGSQPVGMSTGVTAATLLCVCFFVWVGAAGFEVLRQDDLNGRRVRFGHIQRKIFIIICSLETPAGVSKLFFHGWGRSGKRHLQ